ncbi:MAG: PEP-CTERM sorting domain-containing protein [Phycisphaeraceae bacterium]|nr:PEP-CTERM sorting domain-containing protein [Phycisphaeraceae bacterium]
MRTRLLVCAAAIAGASGAAFAQPILESEPNNTMATANAIVASQYPTGAFAFDGAISPGDVDWITFTLPIETIINASTFGRPNSLSGDSQIILVGPGSTIVAFDDDSGLGLFSAFEATVSAGTYFLGVTGFDDLDLGLSGTNPPRIPTGAHQESFEYKLVVGFNPVPAPGSLALLGAGGAMLLRRRR